MGEKSEKQLTIFTLKQYVLICTLENSQQNHAK